MNDFDLFLAQEANKLKSRHGGTWGHHPDYPVINWQADAENDYTRLGYWEWVAAQLEEDNS